MFNEYSCYNWESNKDIFIDEELGKAILNNSQTKYLNIGHITQISTSVAKTPSSKQMKLLSQHLLLWKAFDVVIPFKPNAVFFLIIYALRLQRLRKIYVYTPKKKIIGFCHILASDKLINNPNM